MKLQTGTLLDFGDTLPAGRERLTALFSSPAVRVAAIVSNEHRSPDGFWYDQHEDEWVAVIEGEATIAFADQSMQVLEAGDWLVIPAHTRHRIEKTSERTIWLAIHVDVLKPAGNG